MPVLADKVSVIDTAEKVFENDETAYSLLNQSDPLPYSYTCQPVPSLPKSYKHSPVINLLSSIPSYQAAILLTEYHLMLGDTGPLTVQLRQNIANLARSEECGNKTENVKNVNKLVALQKVNRIMNNKPWAINKYHIEELRTTTLSISEIVHALLIMAHFHTLSEIASILENLQKNEAEKTKFIKKRNSLINGRIEIMNKNERTNLGDCLLNIPTEYLEERHLLDERLSGITCQRYWDDFGFSVLNCLNEQSSLLLDNRFACLQNLRNGKEISIRSLQAIWQYSQQLLGFGNVDYENEIIDQVLDKSQKDMIYRTCFAQEAEDNSKSDKKKVSLLTIVTVQEARMQAEIIYALHAVTQFMNW